MNTLKVKSSFPKAVEALGDAELGRLFRGMMEYAFSGTSPQLPGAERILWPTVKADIDEQLSSFSSRSEANKVNVSKRIERHRIDTNRNESIRIDDSREEEKREEKGEEKSSPSHSPVKENPLKEESKEEENINNKKARFVPPTVEEVRAYCQKRRSTVDPETFVDFYTSKGWKVGQNPMKDWQAAVRTWERSRRGSSRDYDYREASPADKWDWLYTT